MAEKDFEAYLQDLKEITEKMSDTDIKLAEAVSLYKAGMQAADQASAILKQYERELEIVHEDGEV